jgi:hypothetical protein
LPQAGDLLLRMAYSKLWFHVILSGLTDRRLQLNLDHSLPTGCAGRFRTTRWNLGLLAAQRQALDSQAAALQADEEIHALCEVSIECEGRLGA